MNDFKPAKNLLEDQRRQGKVGVYERPIPEAGKPRPGPRNLRRPTEFTPDRCEQWDPKGYCMASQEAVRLGLAKTVQPCTGSIQTICSIQKWLAAGMTVQELFNK